MRFAQRAVRSATLGAVTGRNEKRAFKVEYLYYVLAVLVLGLVCINVVRFATRSKNPDLLKHYQQRQAASQKVAKGHTPMQPEPGQAGATQPAAMPAVKSLRERHHAKTQHRTPWGWPGAVRPAAPQGVSETIRNFTDRLIREKQLVQPGSSDSIRALLESRYSPVNRGMAEIEYQKVKRPLLRDPSEPFDQLDNLGTLEAHRLRQKLQFLSAMNPDVAGPGEKNRNGKKIEFRYVELKDLKQPWGW